MNIKAKAQAEQDLEDTKNSLAADQEVCAMFKGRMGCGIHDTTFQSIMKCDADVRKDRRALTGEDLRVP